MHEKMKFWKKCAEEHMCPTITPNLGETLCQDGMAGEYPCNNVDILSFINLDSLGAHGDGNDVWGWTDLTTGKEYAISAVFDGTSYVDISDPRDPKVLGFLPTHTFGSSWRDVKVYKDHAFIVSEAHKHGMQVFDLTQLRDLPRYSLDLVNQTIRPVHILQETAHYDEFGSAHNIAINEDSGFAYAVGSKTCNSGLHMVNINDPINPLFSGCFGDDGYVHDTQCVNYTGPDTNYIGKEICFCYNEDTLTIVDVTNKETPIAVSITNYNDAQYTHQGWLFPGNGYLLLNDELDELLGDEPTTRTLLWDVHLLDAPFHVSSYYATEKVIDHNLYIKGDRAYLSNYCGGLRVLDTSLVGKSRDDKTKNMLSEVAYLDVSPTCSTDVFLGSWSAYPYFPSGNIVVNTIERGLFVVRVV